MLPEAIELVEITSQDHAGHSIKYALVERFFRAWLIKRLGQPTFIGYDAADCIPIQEPEHQQVAGLVTGGGREVGRPVCRGVLSCYNMQDLCYSPG